MSPERQKTISDFSRSQSYSFEDVTSLATTDLEIDRRRLFSVLAITGSLAVAAGCMSNDESTNIETVVELGTPDTPSEGEDLQRDEYQAWLSSEQIPENRGKTLISQLIEANPEDYVRNETGLEDHAYLLGKMQDRSKDPGFRAGSMMILTESLYQGTGGLVYENGTLSIATVKHVGESLFKEDMKVLIPGLGFINLSSNNGSSVTIRESRPEDLTKFSEDPTVYITLNSEQSELFKYLIQQEHLLPSLPTYDIPAEGDLALLSNPATGRDIQMQYLFDTVSTDRKTENSAYVYFYEIIPNNPDKPEEDLVCPGYSGTVVDREKDGRTIGTVRSTFDLFPPPLGEERLPIPYGIQVDRYSDVDCGRIVGVSPSNTFSYRG